MTDETLAYVILTAGLAAIPLAITYALWQRREMQRRWRQQMKDRWERTHDLARWHAEREDRRWADAEREIADRIEDSRCPPRGGRIEIDNDGIRTRAADGTLPWGIPVVSSEHVRPTPRQIAGVDAVRIVRHGLNDAGLLPASEGTVGPKPGEPFDIAYVFNPYALTEPPTPRGGIRYPGATLLMSPERLDAMSRMYQREAQMHTSGQGKTHPGHKDDCESPYCRPVSP